MARHDDIGVAIERLECLTSTEDVDVRKDCTQGVGFSPQEFSTFELVDDVRQVDAVRLQTRGEDPVELDGRQVIRNRQVVERVTVDEVVPFGIDPFGQEYPGISVERSNASGRRKTEP